MENVKDFLGNDIYVDDIVVFMNVGYRDFNIGKVIKLGKAKATIEYQLNDVEIECTRKTYQFYSQIIKIENRESDYGTN